MRDLSLLELSVRLLVAAAAGIVLGLERELSAQPAGLRTHALVAVGAALFTIAGAYGFADVPHGPNVDPARVAAQVASGVGFLGAGAILRQGVGVRGLTTAATLWLAAALGLASGAGAYDAALVGTAIMVVLLVVLRYAVPLLLRFASPLSILEVEYERGHGTIGPLLRSVASARGRIEHLEVTDDRDDGLRHVTISMRPRRPDDVPILVDAVGRRPEVHAVRLVSRATPASVAGEHLTTERLMTAEPPDPTA
jgi:putative Mg2+ transporter-C (MgtC) family protein